MKLDVSIDDTLSSPFVKREQLERLGRYWYATARRMRRIGDHLLLERVTISSENFEELPLSFSLVEPQ